MPLVEYALCEPSDIITYAQFTGEVGASHDSVIEWLINAVSDRFEGETGRQILAREVTDRLNGTGKQMLLLPQYPVVQVNTLAALYPDGSTWNEYSVDAADLYITASGRMILQGDNILDFPRGTANIAVTYSPGWAEVPHDVKMAAIQWVTDWFNAWRNKRDPVESISFAGVNAFIRSEPVPKKVQPVIDLYRVPAGAAV